MKITAIATLAALLAGTTLAAAQSQPTCPPRRRVAAAQRSAIAAAIPRSSSDSRMGTTGQGGCRTVTSSATPATPILINGRRGHTGNLFEAAHDMRRLSLQSLA